VSAPENSVLTCIKQAGTGAAAVPGQGMQAQRAGAGWLESLAFYLRER
jgi:hypothetical protein